MAVTRLLPALLLSACTLSSDDSTSSIASALTGTAGISLQSSATSVTLSSEAKWNLVKTGSLSGNTVTWTITATKSATVSGQLVLQGQMTVTNTGSGPATIGNIVVNLQARRNNKWKTVSADVANATLGDVATTALIHKQASSEGIAKFVENDASGSLEFMDAADNTVFSLTPQKLIGAGQTTTLLFQATFNNNKLGLVPGTPIRAETIITFGNATTNGNSTANLDIDGSGSLSSDEAHVRSVVSRLGLNVPNQTNGNTTPTLSDTPADIKPVGVSLSNIQINLGATTGTVTATVSGTGSVTNCARLTSPNTVVSAGGYNFTTITGINEQACSTVEVGTTPPTCVAGSPTCRWKDGDERSFGQFQWDAGAVASTLLSGNFSSVYGTFFEIGVASPTSNSIIFQSAARLQAYLPQTGAAAPLTDSVLNPTSTASGSFGANTAALKLNIDFSDRNLLVHNATTPLGDVLLCNVTPTALDGTSLRNLLDVSNAELGNGSSPYSAVDLDALQAEVNVAFLNGVPSTWALDHLFVGACP